MPSLSFDAFFKGLRKGEVGPAVYLHGPEDVLKEEAIAALLDRVLDRSLRDFNLDQVSASSLDPEQAGTLCNTVPMLSDRRVVVIRDVEAWNRRAKGKAVILEYLERPSPGTVLVLVQGAGEADPDKELTARIATVAAEPLPPERALKWLHLEAERLGLRLDDAAAGHMVRVTDAHLGQLRSEIAKLAGLAGDAPLTLERVSGFLGVRHGETQYDWRDVVLDDQTGRAAAILPHVLGQSGVSGVSLVMLLGTSLVGLGLARAHYDRGARGGALAGAVKRSLFSARPARVSYDAASREWSRLAPAWPARRIEAALRAALRADDRLKSTGVTDERGILVDLVMELGQSERAVA